MEVIKGDTRGFRFYIYLYVSIYDLLCFLTKVLDGS